MHPLSKAGKSYRGSKADNENPVADTRLAASLESFLLDWASHFVLSITLFCSARFPPAPGVSNIQHSPRVFLPEVSALKVDRLLNTQTPHSWALSRSSSVPCSRLNLSSSPTTSTSEPVCNHAHSRQEDSSNPTLPFHWKRLPQSSWR